MKIKKSHLTIIPLALIFAIGLILFIGAYSKRDAFSSYNLWGARQTIVESQNLDTDNDGLKDWEEDLYKTDRLNPDTDNDGYLDGEEINSGHNPLIKAPGDEEMFYPLPLGDKYNITNKILNSEFIDSILESYVAQKNEYINDHQITSPDEYGQTIDKTTVQTMFTRAIAEGYPLLIESADQILQKMPEIFNIQISDDNIFVSDDNSTENVKSYIEKTSSILKSKTFLLQQQSFSAVTSAFKEGDFSKIDTVIKDNAGKIDTLKEIVVPSSWKEIHKEGLGLILTIRNIFISFRDLPNDPLKAYAALNEFEKFSDRWNGFIEKAINLAKQQNIEINL
ncbi:MAG: thrombospondin type 3 repeat-containing protein [Patescibacteria group bacterium]